MVASKGAGPDSGGCVEQKVPPSPTGRQSVEEERRDQTTGGFDEHPGSAVEFLRMEPMTMYDRGRGRGTPTRFKGIGLLKISSSPNS